MEIVGLKNFVDDDVNSLIAKFVGVKPPKFMKELKFYIRHYDDYVREQVRFFKDLGFKGKDEELVNDENSLTFDELTLEAIKDVYINEDYKELYDMMLNEED